MDHFLICKNPSCRFVLDLRLNGKLLDSVHLVLKNCPACGGAWTSQCPFCSQPIAVSFADGPPQSACCGHRLRGEAQAA
jgi:hypothetical protein